MSRYLITSKSVFDALEAEFVDSLELEVGPDPLPDVLVTSWAKPRTRQVYKHWDFPPEYAYHMTDRTHPDAAYVVYRETADGNLLCAGGVCCELVLPGIADAQSPRRPECGAAVST